MSCSFCNSHFHNIRACRDPMIAVLYERIKVIYVDMMNQYPYDTEVRFKSVLNRRFNLRELRAVCANFTTSAISRPKQDIINSLYEYYRTHIYGLDNQEAEDPWLEARRLPTQPDPIPDFARDLEQPPEDEEHDITWYIDRTPSPVSIIRFNRIQVPATPERINYGVLLQLTGGERLRARDLVGTNLMSHFDAVSGNIPFAPRVKKYNITPVLEVEEAKEVDEEKEEEKEEKELVEDCAICYESIKCMDLVKLNCEHKFCGVCIKETLKSHNKLCGPSCALCRKQMVSFTVKNQEVYNLLLEHCN